jgi:hypothetical protein
MARVEVLSAEMKDERVETLVVNLHNLGERSLDRQTAIQWMRDGHSFIPKGKEGLLPALQLCEVDQESYIRNDHQAIAADDLPQL